MNDINSQLLMLSTAQGLQFSLVGPAKVKACKSFVFTQKFLIVKIKNTFFASTPLDRGRVLLTSVPEQFFKRGQQPHHPTLCACTSAVTRSFTQQVHISPTHHQRSRSCRGGIKATMLCHPKYLMGGQLRIVFELSFFQLLGHMGHKFVLSQFLNRKFIRILYSAHPIKTLKISSSQ